MSRKVSPFECSAAQGVRDEAREYVGEFFPKARIDLQLGSGEHGIGVVARVLGDPTPHDPGEIVDCLGQLGVMDVSFIEHETAAQRAVAQH